MSRSRRLLGMLVVACGFNSAAHADINSTGPWSTTIFGLTAISQWVQTGSDLTVDLSNFSPLSPVFTGTIDPVTGIFSLGAPSICPYAGDSITGTVAPDGRTFAGFLSFHGTFDCCLNPMACGSEVLGTRCGNGVLDPGEQCDDGNNVNGDGCDAFCHIETCYVCSGQPSACAPAPNGSPCDNGNPCATNVCDGSGACTVTGVRSCRSAETSMLLVKASTTASKDKLNWKWIKGAATTLTDLGVPTGTTNYTLCVYAGTAVATVNLPAGSDWKAAGTTGFKFKDPTGIPDGAQKASLRSGGAGKAKALVKGKGSNLPDTLAPPLTLPVTAQLVNDTNNVCFGSVFNTSNVSKNDAKQFKAKTP